MTFASEPSVRAAVYSHPSASRDSLALTSDPESYQAPVRHVYVYTSRVVHGTASAPSVASVNSRSCRHPQPQPDERRAREKFCEGTAEPASRGSCLLWVKHGKARALQVSCAPCPRHVLENLRVL
jgi:hypothetical protein